LQGPSGNPWLFATDDKISAMSDDNSHEFFIVGDPNAGANEAKNGRQVISRAEELIGDREKAEVWFQYHPLPAFENKTPRQLVGEGRSDAVLLHLDTLEDGAYA
jgi:antitoxin Xre/MbcA/ParS-like protein